MSGEPKSMLDLMSDQSRELARDVNREAAPRLLTQAAVKMLCPACMCGGGQCARCNGTGYVWKDPFDPSSTVTGFTAEEAELLQLRDRVRQLEAPIPMLLWCPRCWLMHVDRDEWATRPHREHKCEGCNLLWTPANVHTLGVEMLPEAA